MIIKKTDAQNLDLVPQIIREGVCFAAVYKNLLDGS